MKSTRRRSDFTRRQAHFTLRNNISPTRRVDFVEKSTSEEVLFSGVPGGIRLARLRALGRSRSQQSTGLLLCTARPSNPSSHEKKVPASKEADTFWRPRRDCDSRACGRLVARGHNSPPDCCSVPLVLRIPPHMKRKCPPLKRQALSGVPGGIRTHGLSLRRRTLYPAELRRHIHLFTA